jgi:hypothetical protein
MKVLSAVHFDEHVAIDIAQRLHDPALCLVTLFLIEVRRRFVRLNRHADHEPLSCFAPPSEVDKTAIRVTNFSSFRAASRASALLCNSRTSVFSVIARHETIGVYLMRVARIMARALANLTLTMTILT